MANASKLFFAPIALIVTALLAPATDIAGKWTGLIIIDDGGNKIETPVEMELQLKNGVLAGTIGRANDPERTEIRNAKQDGNTVTFEAASVEVSASMKFSLTIEGERMEGEMKGAAQGNDIVAKVSFSRVK